MRKLTAVAATASAGSASSAAKKLNATQPAVTAAIASMEAELGTALFNRTPRGMSPTFAGEQFAGRVEEALSLIDQVDIQLKARRQTRTTYALRRTVSETQFQALMALCDNGSFHGAARQLGISQPAVSRSIRDLEAITGVNLWERAGLTGQPSPEGRLLARAAGVFLREIELAVEDIQHQHGLHNGTLQIGALPLSRSQWVPASIIELLKQFPDSQIRIVDGPYTEQLHALHHGKIDLIVGALRPEERQPSLVQVPMFDDGLAVVVRPGHPVFAIDHGTESDWLSKQTWVLPVNGTPGRERFIAYLAAQGLPPPQHVIECGSLVATRALLRGSDFAAPLSLRQIKLELETGLLAVVKPILAGTERSIGVTRRQGFRPTRLYSAFLEALTSSCQTNVSE